jgi:hypothetical protein
LIHQINKNVKTWARWALSDSERDSEDWDNLIKNSSPQDLAEMLSFVAGYFGANEKGRLILNELAV